MTAIQVRPAVGADIEGVWPLVSAFAPSFRPERSKFEGTFSLLLEAPDSLVLVARSADRVVGYLLAHIHHAFLANGPIAWVEELMVDESARMSGAGRLLMSEAERWADDSRAAYVSLASRDAGAFYRHLGYEDAATFYKKQPLLHTS